MCSADAARVARPPPSTAARPCARPRTTSCQTPLRSGGAHIRREDQRSEDHVLGVSAFVTGPVADRSRRASPSRGGRRQEAFPSTEKVERAASSIVLNLAE